MINFRATADTLYAHVPVARVGEPSKQHGPLHFYTLQFVYNSQLLVFCRAQSPTTIHGYATNWNSTGWEEIYPQQSKFSVKFWQAVSWCHQDNVMINGHNSLYINAKFVWDNQTFWEYDWSIEWTKFPHTHSIFHTLLGLW
jgi:hypothetical protein